MNNNTLKLKTLNKNLKVLIRTLVVLCIFLCFSFTAKSQILNIWTGNANSDWDNPANWQTPVVPNSAGWRVLIPNTSSDPIIDGSITIHDIIVNTGGELKIESSGELNLSATNLSANMLAILSNLGTIENIGTITISSQEIIPNYVYAINNENLVENYGTIEIQNSKGHGIYNTGDFLNRGGECFIGSVNTISGKGILIEDGIVLSQNFLGSTGKIEIDRTADDGIEIASDGNFQITGGLLTIGSDVTVDKFGIDIYGDFLGNGGTVNIARSTWSGIKNHGSGELTNSGAIINIGTIDAVAHGVNNSGTITNSKTISIKRANNHGINNESSGEITNSGNGKIEIGTISPVGEYGINNAGTITNHNLIDVKKSTDSGLINASTASLNNDGGTIKIDDFQNSGIYTQGPLENSGTINIGQSTGGNGSGISMEDGSDIQNHGNGVINIDNIAGTAILASEGTLDNDGTINIGQAGGLGNITSFSINIRNDLTNNGSINIDNAKGILCIYLFSDFINNGEVNIGQNGGLQNITSQGLLSNQNDNILNMASGIIRIDNTTDDALQVSRDFTNYGTIEIGLTGGPNNVDGHAIDTRDDFTNETGALININNCTGKGLFLDESIFTIKECSEVNINEESKSQEDSQFINQGLYKRQGTFYLEGEIEISPMTIGCVLDDAITYLASTDLTVLDEWFLDENLTDKAGNYEPLTNQFIPTTDLPAGTTTLYFTVSSPTCTYDINVETTSDSNLPMDVINWIGYEDSEWNNPENWCPNGLPSLSQDVIINKSDNDPIINGSTSTSIKSLSISFDAQLEIMNGGNITIDDFMGNGIDMNGTIVNNGTIDIAQSIGGGSVGINMMLQANLYNNSNGIINIDNITGTALLASFGVLSNDGTINIGQTGGLGNITSFSIDFGNITYNNGTINIDNAKGIRAYDQYSDFSNNGEVNIGQNGGLNSINSMGLESNLDNNIYNLASGIIRIDNTTNNGMQVAGDFTNYGTIEIGLTGGGGNIKGVGFRATGICTIETGALVNIKNTTGDGSHIFGWCEFWVKDCAVFNVNNEYWRSTNSYSTIDGMLKRVNITNIGDELIISPTAWDEWYDCNHEDIIEYLNNSQDFYTVLDEWYLDENLTNKAGDYDQATNHFTPINLSSGTNTVYFTVSSSTCTYNVSVNIKVPVDIDYTRTWSGAEDSDWDNPCNWVSGFVPRVSEDVIIPPTANNPSILSGSSTYAKSVEVDAGANLTISIGGNLIIDGSIYDGFSNYGTFNNYGVLEIDNVNNAGIRNFGGTFNNYATIYIGQNAPNSIDAFGVWNNGYFTNEVGEIKIDQVGSIGIYNTGGNFVNRATINIGTIGSIGGPGIRNHSSFYNESGVLNIDNAQNGILNMSGSFYNSTTLYIGQNIGIDEIGIINQTDLLNYNDIYIDKANITGLYQNINGYYANFGTLNIGQSSTSDTGLNGIESEGEFINFNRIDIDNITDSGIKLSGPNAILINLATLNIGANSISGDNGILVDLDAHFENETTGNIEIKNLSTGIKTSSGGGDFINYGSITFDNHFNFAIESLDAFTNNGTIGGNGGISISSNEIGGTISPGFSPGQMLFINNLQFLSNSILEIEIEGSTNGLFDHVIGLGSMDISNMSLDINIDYAPEIGDRIVFLETSILIGSFNTDNPSLPSGWELDYSVPEEVALVFTAVLPVELIHFDVSKTEKTKALLTWQTASEANNYGFEIEFSDNGLDWELAGFAEGYGNSNAIRNYSFIHDNPQNGINYYRLRQIDLDGKSEYSDLRVIRFDSAKEEVKLFPNPVSTIANIQLPDNFESACVNAFNVKGQHVFQACWDQDSGPTQIDASTWQNGLYIIRFNIDGQEQTQKLLVAHN